MLKDTPFGYGAVSKILHWVLAVLIIINLGFGLSFDYIGDLRGAVMPLHKSLGILVLALMLVRAVWRAHFGFPKLPAGIPEHERRYARLAHFAFYPILILMPLSGWILSSAAGRPVNFFGLMELPNIIAPDPAIRSLAGETHEIVAWVLLILLALHIAAALYHHYVQKLKLIRRMM